MTGSVPPNKTEAVDLETTGHHKQSLFEPLLLHLPCDGGGFKEAEASLWIQFLNLNIYLVSIPCSVVLPAGEIDSLIATMADHH